MRKIDLNNFQVATSGTARDINRRIVLNLIRKHQPISRADLSRHSGLQRSTVSAITEQLIAKQWLREGDLGQLPRGRKPTFLHLNENRGGIFGLNVRPSWTNMALANLGGQFIEEETMPTPASAAAFVTQVSRRIRKIMANHPQMTYEGVGVSLPGRVELSSQKFVFAPNLGWRLEDLKSRLEESTGLPVDLENEANACALSEFWFGHHGDDVRNLLAVAVSEGIGVGLVLNGQLVRGPSGFAGEFGHVALSETGPLCRCGNQGCWEVFASNNAAVRRYRELRATEAGGKPSDHSALDFNELLRLAEEGDTAAEKSLREMGRYLGRGIGMLVSGLAPDVIVVVGEVTRAWELVGPQISQAVAECSYTHASTRIAASGPASLPRLRGIVALVLQKHFGAPLVA